MENETEITEEQAWQISLMKHAIHAHAQGFLNENGLRTINFVHENTIYSLTVDAKPSNIIPFPKETA